MKTKKEIERERERIRKDLKADTYDFETLLVMLDALSWVLDDGEDPYE